MDALVEIRSSSVGTNYGPGIVDSVEDDATVLRMRKSSDLSRDFIRLHSWSFEFIDLTFSFLANVENLTLRRNGCFRDSGDSRASFSWLLHQLPSVSDTFKI